MGSGDNVFTVVAKNIDVLAMPLLSLVFPLFPIWSYAKLIAVCWLVLPYFNGAAYVYENWIRPFYRNPQVKLWYVPRKKDIFSKPDDVLTAAEKYIEENGPEAFERLIARADREARTRRSSYTIFHDDYEY
ncbi:HVA22-like protein a [Sesamum angolense]|uniref:HVA22-like protein n=1 Tax=Sesamum angolense TaxID=2727404 RepID=A0AAE2BZ10_9LAMI|nr:HVA22-like protein a [Sesamum angolense]